MIAIVTDAHYRMSVALIRDLADAGVQVIACEQPGTYKPVGFASRAAWQCYELPEGDVADGLLALCRDVTSRCGEKPALLPVGARTLAAVAGAREVFDEVAGLCILDPGQLALLNDKAALAQLAQRLGIAVPQSFSPELGESVAHFAARAPLPCVVKPLCGEAFGLSAAQRYVIARTPQALEEAYTRFFALTNSAPVVQEYLPGAALGCSILAQDGRVVASIAHRRVREYPVTGGPSSCCRVADETPLLRAVCALVRETGFSGIAMFEFKCGQDGTPRLLECNPRVWGTYPLTRAAGTNFSYLWCCAALGEPLPDYIRPRPVKMTYQPADLAAGLGYLARGKIARALGVLGSLLDPRVKNGLFEWRDAAPGLRYFAGLFRRARR